MLFRSAEPVAACAAFHPKLEAVLALLAQPDQTWTQAELARRVQLSPYTLSDLFRRQTGLALPDYRNRLRLQEFFRRCHARPEIRLLQHALDSGFGSYAQFYRVFTEALGQSPRDWLRQAAPRRRTGSGHEKAAQASRPGGATGSRRFTSRSA